MGFVQKSTRLPFMYGVIVCTVTIGTLFMSSSIDRNARNARIYDRSAAQKGARKLMETDLISDEAINVLEHYPLQNDDYFYDYSDYASSKNIARLENLVRFGQSSYIYESSLELENADVQVAHNGLLNPDGNRETEKQKLTDFKADNHINQPNAEDTQKITNQQQTIRDKSQITDHPNPDVKHQEPESQLVPAKQQAIPGTQQTADPKQVLENQQNIHLYQQVSINQQHQRIQENPPPSTNQIARNSQSTGQKFATEYQQQNTVQQNPKNQLANNQANEQPNESPQTSAKLQQTPNIHQQNDNSGTASNQRQIFNQKQPESQPLQVARNQGQKPIQPTSEKPLQLEETEEIQTNDKTNTHLDAGIQQPIQSGAGNGSEFPKGQQSVSNTGQQKNSNNPQLDGNEKTAPKDQSHYSNQQPISENKPKDVTVPKPVGLPADEQRTKNMNLQGVIKVQAGVKQPQSKNKNEVDTQPEKQSTTEDQPTNGRLLVSNHQGITDKKQTTENQLQNPNQQIPAYKQRQSEGPLETVNKPSDMAVNEISPKQKDICTSISFAPSGSFPLIGLVSFPGSGNTWTRLLIELATGIYTGSVYKDLVLYKGGFRGEIEAVGSGTTIVTKTHYFPRGRQYNFTKVILLIRNPFDAILAEYNRQNGPHGINQSHISFADPEVFKGAKFIKFATGAAGRWFDKIRTLLKEFKSSDRLIIYYESLKDEVTVPLERMLRFIGHPVDEERLQCTKRHADNPEFHRPHKSLGFDPFTEEVTKIINKKIQMARELINTYQLDPLPDYAKEKFR